jgi:hypothetical protein
MERDDPGKGANMLTDELLRTIIDERNREIAQAQRIRSAKGFRDDERGGRSWLQHLSPTTPSFGGRTHPGKATGGSTL